MEATMVANLREKTGRDLAGWLEVVKATGLSKHGEIVKHLKSEYAVGHGYANLVAARALQAAAPAPATGGDAAAEIYSGAKAGLRPIHDAVMGIVNGFGPDVEVSPKKGYVSLRRKKQFAMVQPSTATRVDIGLNLKGVPPAGRLEASGSFSSMVTHRVRVASREEVDSQLTGWLRQAYDAAG
jgi:hypothetical protein